jgi:hypothetical protein
MFPPEAIGSDNPTVDGGIVWRAAALQAGAVAVISIALALALPHSFFEDWGWLTGPAAWALCATFTARVLGLPTLQTLVGALLAGLPSLVAVVAGLHWLGALFAVVLFALWCGATAARRLTADGGRVA